MNSTTIQKEGKREGVNIFTERCNLFKTKCFIESKSITSPSSRNDSNRIVFPRSLFLAEEKTQGSHSPLREITTPLVEAIVQFEDNYDFTKDGTMLKNCSQSCSYLFQDW